MKVIRYKNSGDIDVEFLDNHRYVFKRANYQSFRKETIKNPYDITCCGVGYIGDGKYSSSIGKSVMSEEYDAWINMLSRCYSKHRLGTTYSGICNVCDEWLNFQNYAEWYTSNIYHIGTERMHVDKDILHKDNKLYSPDRCLIVPQRINMLFHDLSSKRKYDKDLPQGIRRTKSNKFRADYNTKPLGIFQSLDDAIEVYNKEKILNIHNVANEYKELIPSNVYEALINWRA